MKTYISFGKIHKHNVGGVIFDRNCIGVLESNDDEDAIKIILNIFGNKLSTIYHEKDWDDKNMKFYERGYISIPYQQELCLT